LAAQFLKKASANARSADSSIDCRTVDAAGAGGAGVKA
jgi:hypothetical protein